MVGVLALGSLTACNFDSAVEHNDKVVAIVDKATTTYDAYGKFATETELSELDAIEQKRKETLETEKTYLAELGALKPYNSDDTDLIDAGKEYVQTSIDVLENEEKALLALWANEEISEEEFETQQKELIDAINEKLDTAGDMFDKKQEQFAKDHGYEVEE